MFRNYLKIAFRNLWKRRAFSLINIFGLTIGMTACFLIFLYVRFEFSYNGFHQKADRIYRLVCDIKTPTDLVKSDGPAFAVLPAVKIDFPEVESAVRIVESSLLLRKGDIKFQEENSLFADPAFFRVFDFKLLEGNPGTVLKDPFTMVITQSAAKKYFGDANPVGQTLLITGKGFPVRITGLMKDMPGNSQIKGDILVSMSTETENLNKGLEEDWEWTSYHPQSFILLRTGVDPRLLEKRFVAFMDKHDGEDMRKQQTDVRLFLEPLKNMYLYSTRNGSKTVNSKNVVLFSFVAAIILLIACINFVNLTTARSAERAKEVGIRKVVGALRPELARQFIGESLLLCLVAFLLTIFFSAWLIPGFNQLAGKTVSEGIFEHPVYIAFLFFASLAIGVLSGFYPALVLSAMKPASVLKGRFTTGTQGNLLRKGLVLIQFSLSTGFIIMTIVVYNQLRFMRGQDLGFSRDQIMVINTEGDKGKTSFLQSLKGLPGVLSTSLASSVPGSNNPVVHTEIENNKGVMQVAPLDLYFVDWDYMGQYKIRMAAGRSFSRDFQTDTTQAMLINETAARTLGFYEPGQAIGKKFSQFGREGKIVGVMKDFHFHSLQQAIEPLSMRIEPYGCFLVSVTVSTTELRNTISAIESKWKSAIPYRPLIYYFLDEHFDKQYRSDERFGKLFLYFSVLAIFISCMGLLGLASYSTLQRTREIGVRKVMGASVLQIVNLLSRDYLKLVIISFLVASPTAWWFMHRWLLDFAYRIPISGWIFLAAGLLALLVAMLTISFQAVRASLANPVKSLKSE
jgi:putative ABC transport system permease protein